VVVGQGVVGENSRRHPNHRYQHWQSAAAAMVGVCLWYDVHNPSLSASARTVGTSGCCVVGRRGKEKEVLKHIRLSRRAKTVYFGISTSSFLVFNKTFSSIIEKPNAENIASERLDLAGTQRVFRAIILDTHNMQALEKLQVLQASQKRKPN